MAIEDALTLKVLLPTDTQPTDICDRLLLYEQIRKPRVARVRETSRRIALGGDDKNIIPEYRRFLAEHDVVAYAEHELQKHLVERS